MVFMNNGKQVQSDLVNLFIYTTEMTNSEYYSQSY